ncbi:MAG: glycosyltransferase family 2 protein [Propionibacteriaceae bacterium]|nr:glycosyltransferase family 2 protein [Propionibacteriaceae bacterium]
MSDVDLFGHTVTAILVCRNAGAWLNATLASLGQLDRRPELILAVDNESTDDTAELLRDAEEAGLITKVINGRAGYCFGQAVERAMGLVTEPTQWLWLLHDDAVPDQDALTELLTLAARTPKLAIAVPLLVRPSRRHHAALTLEVGASISATGRRTLGLEPGEVAQGQYESSPVLGGSTCGMLVRWESLVEMGGFDPCISGYRDGIDLGWRAHLMEQWVMTCPTARIVHRQVGRSEIRPGTLAVRAKRSEASWDRLMGLRLVAANTRGLGKLGVLLRSTFVCLMTALALVLGRAPDRAKDEIQAWMDFLFRSRRPVVRLRRKIRAISRGSNTKHRVRSLRPTLGSVADEMGQYVARWFQDQFASNSDAEMTLDDLLGDEFTRRIGDGSKRIPLAVWLGLLVGGLVIATRTLYASGMVMASNLLGAPASIASAFDLALSKGAESEPWLLVNAALSVLTIHPQWLPVVVLITAFPLTMLVAGWFARHRIAHTRLRWFAAAGYALLPILMGGMNRGSLWLIGCALMLPFLAEWFSRIDRPWAGARSLQTMAGIAFGGVIVFAMSPVLWVAAIAAALVITLRAGGIARIIRIAIALAIPIGFWARSIPALLSNPIQLLLFPEPLLTPEALSWQMLIGRPFADGLPPMWVSIVVFAALWIGVLVIVIQNRRRLAVVVGMAAIAAGIWVSRFAITMDYGTARVDPTAFLLVGFAILLFACVAWIDETFGSLEGRDFGGKQAMLALLSFVLVAAFGIGAVWSAYAGFADVQRGKDPRVPAYLAENEIEQDTATLIIDAGNRTWNLRYGGGTTWGQGSYLSGPAASPEAMTMIWQIVSRALEGRSADTSADDLASLGVSAVVVIDPNPDSVSALDSSAGLQRATVGGMIEIWTVNTDSGPPTRRALVSLDGSSLTYLSPRTQISGSADKVLLLATPPDPDLRVFVGGVEVQPTESPDWRAAYLVKDTGGLVSFERTVENSWLVWIQLGVIILLIIFVLPPLTAEDPDSPRHRIRRAR